jgi:hypothetical protein
MNANHENISLLLLSRVAFFVVRVVFVFHNAGELRFLFFPRPFKTLPIKFCADSDMRLETMSTGLTSGDVLSNLTRSYRQWPWFRDQVIGHLSREWV